LPSALASLRRLLRQVLLLRLLLRARRAPQRRHPPQQAPLPRQQQPPPRAGLWVAPQLARACTLGCEASPMPPSCPFRALMTMMLRRARRVWQ
jgi:hypothetical protein